MAEETVTLDNLKDAMDANAGEATEAAAAAEAVDAPPADAAADAGSRTDTQTHFFCHHSLPGVAACQTRIFCCSINCSISASL